MNVQNVSPRQLAWQVHAQKVHALVWLGTQLVLHELSQLCHMLWESILLFGLWHYSLAQYFDAYERWTLVARRYFSLQVHAEDWARIRRGDVVPSDPPLMKLKERAHELGFLRALTVLTCAATAFVNVSRWYYSIPVDTLEVMDQYATYLLCDWISRSGAV
ncbi:hypothetical protein PYCCODRAFT_1460350 [Trametes coccinea BRFM310]|uniref:Uncharacterized protein n=1 Tax=Trametes coccinea (strain BRFM310) TaxID=1353009 RepID=A0A1Y2IGK1_TRAC3|nr:hypothetical protein PYCCODRAFT_1460350 [Trametes coccinea BRFM310]